MTVLSVQKVQIFVVLYTLSMGFGKKQPLKISWTWENSTRKWVKLS